MKYKYLYPDFALSVHIVGVHSNVANSFCSLVHTKLGLRINKNSVATSSNLEKEGMELLEPQVGKDCYIAPGATIIGSVQISECCTVWPGIEGVVPY